MNTRRRMTGVVTSNKMMKTVVVEITRTYQHPLYHKIVHSRKRVKAHDELSCKVGDRVVVVESQPISAQKHWVVEKLLRRERSAEAPVLTEVDEMGQDTEAGA